MRTDSMKNSTEFCIVNKQDVEKKYSLQGWPRPFPGQNFCGTNADARSVCGS